LPVVDFAKGSGVVSAVGQLKTDGASCSHFCSRKNDAMTLSSPTGLGPVPTANESGWLYPWLGVVLPASVPVRDTSVNCPRAAPLGCAKSAKERTRERIVVPRVVVGVHRHGLSHLGQIAGALDAVRLLAGTIQRWKQGAAQRREYKDNDKEVSQ